MTREGKEMKPYITVVARQVIISDIPKNEHCDTNPNCRMVEIQTFSDIYTGCMHTDNIPKKDDSIDLTIEATPTDYHLMDSGGTLYKMVPKKRKNKS